MNPQPHLQAGGPIQFSRTRTESNSSLPAAAKESDAVSFGGRDRNSIRKALATVGFSVLVVLGQKTVMAQSWPSPNPYIRTAPYPQQTYAQPNPQSYPQSGYPAQAPAYPDSAPQPGYAQQDQYGQQAYPQQQPYTQQPRYSQQPNPDQQQAYGDQSYAPPAQNYAPDNYSQQQPVAQPLSAEQLEQLVAPIALYPDALVAQVLAAATYPAQVSGADQWRQAMGYASPDQIVAGADAQSWDPSVKALTAFPQVLSMLDRNLQWTTDLGNAYFNQPQDVLQTIQVMRQRAQSAGTLQSSPQEAVSYDQGYIELAPANPQVVYVPAYNPWNAYGQPVTPYSGFSLSGVFGAIGSIGSSLLNYGPGIAMGAFSHSPWGLLGWAINWLSQSVLFNHSDYSSHSMSVAHWNLGRRGGEYSARGSYGDRGSFGDRNSYGRPGERYNRFANGDSFAGRSNQWSRPVETPRPGFGFSDRGFGGNQIRPALPTRPMPLARPPQEAFNRTPEPMRPGYGYGSGFGNRPGEGNGFHAGEGFANPAPVYRGPSVPQRGSFGDRYSSPSMGRGFAEPGRGFSDQRFKPEKSGGFHPFGGGHNNEFASAGKMPRGFGGEKMPKMPKSFGHESMPKAPHFSEHGHGGGGHSGGGHFFGGHHH